MERQHQSLSHLTRLARFVVGLLCWSIQPALHAADYFITIGGGYRPDSNQASLEANVLFFRQVLATAHRGPRTEAIFFADGSDPQADLQYVEPPQGAPVTELLEELFSFGEAPGIAYRNHAIPHVSGANSPTSIRASLQHMCRSMKAGDRLFIYVTAHGGEAKGRNPYNTSISCWDEQSITAREFANWLNDVPTSVPVTMVMAQCYCGGFAQTIFRNLDPQQGLQPHLRIGFFAQQHDLPAAGCRPDIENDEEYSSFFWGAMLGQTRSGKQLSDADFDGDGRVSLAEAHAQAILTSQTIDIPLRSSEVLLRTYSRIANYDLDHSTEIEAAAVATEGVSDADLDSLQGTGNQIVQGVSPALQRTVWGLLEQLDIRRDDDLSEVFEQFAEQRQHVQQLARDARRGGRRRSGRRELREEISEHWPELGEREWREAEILRSQDQAELQHAIQQLASYQRYQENLAAREATRAAQEKAELREVKFRRLISALESIVLAKNLPKVATPDIVAHYQKMLELEQASLGQR